MIEKPSTAFVSSGPEDEASFGSSRPYSMVLFDRFMLTTLAINLITLFQAFSLMESLGEKEWTIDRLIGWIVIGFLIMFGLWFCASRLRSNLARWILALISARVVLTFISSAPSSISLSPAYFFVGLLGVLASFASMCCLFVPASRTWFAAKGGAKPGESLSVRLTQSDTASKLVRSPDRVAFGRKRR